MWFWTRDALAVSVVHDLAPTAMDLRRSVPSGVGSLLSSTTVVLAQHLFTLCWAL